MPQGHANPVPGPHNNPGGAHHQAPGEGHALGNPNEPHAPGGHEIPVHGEAPPQGHPEHPQAPEHPVEPGGQDPHELDIPPASPVDFGVFDPPRSLPVPDVPDSELMLRLHALPAELQHKILEQLDTTSLLSVIKSEQVPESQAVLLRESQKGQLISLTGRKVVLSDGALKEVGGVVLADAVNVGDIADRVRRRQLLRERDILEAPAELVRQANEGVFELWLENVTNALLIRDDFPPEVQLQMIIDNASLDGHYSGIPGLVTAPQFVVRELVAAQQLVWSEDLTVVTLDQIHAANDESRVIVLLAKMALREVQRIGLDPA
jgi:hypothetical protein